MVKLKLERYSRRLGLLQPQSYSFSDVTFIVDILAGTPLESV